MSPLLIAVLGVMLIPLFVGSWRVSLLGLGLQGLLMALIFSRLSHGLTTAGDWVGILDLAAVRGVGVPLVLAAVLHGQKVPARNNVIPPNLLSWTLALAMVLLAFNFSAELVPQDGDQQTLVAVATAGVMLGFLVLATQSGPFSQIVGVLRIENAIALFELSGERHHAPLGIQVGLLAALVVTVALFRWYLVAFDAAPTQDPDAVIGGPTL